MNYVPADCGRPGVYRRRRISGVAVTLILSRHMAHLRTSAALRIAAGPARDARLYPITERPVRLFPARGKGVRAGCAKRRGCWRTAPGGAPGATGTAGAEPGRYGDGIRTSKRHRLSNLRNLFLLFELQRARPIALSPPRTPAMLRVSPGLGYSGFTESVSDHARNPLAALHPPPELALRSPVNNRTYRPTDADDSA